VQVIEVAARKLAAAALLAAVLTTVGASAASARLTTVGLAGWQVQSSAKASQSGARISRPGFRTRAWLHVKPDDAGAPGTEVGALVQGGRCPNVFFSTNMKRCFGYIKQLGADTIPTFSVPWWFRTTFTASGARSQHLQLIINGVVGKADVWVDGKRVATAATVQGDYTRYSLNITDLVHRGSNALALKLFPNDPSTMFTLDNVDWTQIPPDNNTGIQFPIQLHTSGALAIGNVHVVQHDSAGMSRAALTLKANVTNYARSRRRGHVSATVATPSGGSIALHETVLLAPHTTTTVALRSSRHRRLLIHHPRVWWPYQMGSQPLYRLRMAVSQTGGAADSQSETFGIRTIQTRLVGRSAIAPQGSRQFMVNGRPFVFRGGGWSEDLLLRYSSADTANQIAMIKNLGLNGIRTEGKQLPADFYEQMDRAGILIDGGFQCCDAWELPSDGKGVSKHDYAVLGLSALTIGENMRNHPSVLNFSWSDNNPIPRQERVSLRGFREADFQDPLIASAEYKSTPTLGPSGEKEGPYDWVPPSYWYDTSHYDKGDSSRTNAGGAWAFDSEASAGDTVPTLDSIRRFMSPFEQTQLWRNPNYNQYHTNHEPDLPAPSNGGYSFGTLHDLDKAIKSRYGGWSSLGRYVEKAQVQNYETQRAEFEAYVDHSTRSKAPSTGIVYWQLNKGWPTLLWDLYNNDLDQAGSYFGAKKANEPLHALFAYDTGAVDVDNLSGRRETGLSVRAKVYGVDGRVLYDRTASGVAIGAQGVARGVLHPRTPARTTPPAKAKTYFLELLLSRRGQVVDRNVYWLSTQRDVVNWSKTIGNPQAKMIRYANLTALDGLPAARIRVSAHTAVQRGAGGADTATSVTITNTSANATVAFFLRADIRRGSSSGVPARGDNEVLPVAWSDNDITLWPGESETLRSSYRRSDLRGAAPVVSVSAWNVPTADVAAP
jgi:exo-1,4-beta-D-glucosaminidase